MQVVGAENPSAGPRQLDAPERSGYVRAMASRPENEKKQASAEQGRAERLKVALKSNIARRKAQAKARDAAARADDEQ